MLDKSTIKKINGLVYQKPRSIDELAKAIGKNWRTADRYVKQISEEEGTISTKTFREGSRGALKVVFWNNIEKISSNSFQEKLFNRIEQGRTKKDFSPFDIYQYVEKKKRNAFMEYRTDKNKAVSQDLIGLLRRANTQILHFSGNNSWINLTENKKSLLKATEELAMTGVKMKILSRVEIPGLENIKKLLDINERIGKEMIEIRHCHQPLRGFIIDNEIIRFREQLDPKYYERGELKGEKSVFYEIKDEEWIDWMQKVFWNLYRTSIPAQKRIKDIKEIYGVKF